MHPPIADTPQGVPTEHRHLLQKTSPLEGHLSGELVSVIMPTYNGASLMESSIRSVLSQSYHHLELLITDDHSTSQQTLAILHRYERLDERVKVEYLAENSGPAFARNHAIRRARGRYIAFCDSDDQWKPDKLERQLRMMSVCQCALSFSSYIVRGEDNTIKGIVRAPHRLTYSQLKRDNKIGCSTAIYDTRLLGSKYFMPQLQKRQDWGLFLSIMEQCNVAYAVESPLSYYTVRRGSVSSSKCSLVKYNVAVYRQVLHFSPAKSWLYFLGIFMPTYLLKVVRKRYDSFFFLRHRHGHQHPE